MNRESRRSPDGDSRDSSIQVVTQDSWDARVGAAIRGENPMVMARMRSGFAVIGDTQHLPGYSLLLCGQRGVEDLHALAPERRLEFLLDLALLGEAVALALADEEGFRRVNYEVLGNSVPWLHGHVHARWSWEPAERAEWPVWCYPQAERSAPSCAYSDERHGAVRAAITGELERLMAGAYGGVSTSARD